ncbi:MAG: LysR substrate-binding domain-containing protein [Promethearchaeota archaeon]
MEIPKELLQKVRLEDLYVFIVLCEEKNYLKAASRLGKTQGTVSLEINRLEKLLKTKLIFRTSKAFKITDDGKTFLQYSQNVIEETYKFLNKLKLNAEKVSGIINISSSSIPGEYFLPNYIGMFKSIHSNVDFKIKISNSTDAFKDLENNIAEIAAVGLEIPQNRQSKYDFISLAEDTLIFICDKNHEIVKKEEISIADLYKYPFILREQGSATRKTFEASKYYLDEFIRINLELDLNQSILTALKNSNYITILSSFTLGLNVKEIRDRYIKNSYVVIIPIDYKPIRRKFFLIKKKNLDINSPAFRFWNFCVDKAVENA